MKGIKAEQFDPAKDYPEHAWCAGPMDFRHAGHRGHTMISKNDWIVTFEETGEHIAVTDATYQKYFAEPSLVQKYLGAEPELPAAQAPSPEVPIGDKPQVRRLRRAQPVEGENPELGQPANGKDDSSDA